MALANRPTPRFRRSRARELLVVAVAVIVAVLRWLSGDTDSSSTRIGSAGLPPGMHTIERAVDGDTLVVAGNRLRIRLQGVDTPETVKEGVPVQPWGPEASAFTKSFLAEAHARVRIEVDGEPRDQHGRYLAFLWHGQRMLNEELVRRGLARATLQYDFSERKKEVLRAAQREARRSKLGIWSDAGR